MIEQVAPSATTALVQRRLEQFRQDNARVIARYFGPESHGHDGILRIVAQLLDMPAEKRALEWEQTRNRFSSRHRDFSRVLRRHFARLIRWLDMTENLELSQRAQALEERGQLLIASYVTCEYSVEAAAFFNPSIVAHPSQEGVPEGSVRFVMSFRSTGEGHISSVAFRSGLIDEHFNIKLDKVSPFVSTPVVEAAPAVDEVEIDGGFLVIEDGIAAIDVAFEFAAATERVHALQKEAAKVFLVQEQRFMRFVALTERIHMILQPRIEAFTNVNVFKDIKQNVSLELRGPESQGFHGRTTTLSVPSSDACSGKVELSFRLRHDGPIENAIMVYRLEIVPIFIKFDSHDQLVIPIDDPSEDAIAAWIDEKLVGFTRTYFEMYFTEQYQKQSFEMDPVMNIRSPSAFAAGKKEYQGRVYHFFTPEALQAFEKAPSEYVAVAECPRPECSGVFWPRGVE